jgi:hypothetical protein
MGSVLKYYYDAHICINGNAGEMKRTMVCETFEEVLTKMLDENKMVPKVAHLISKVILKRDSPIRITS